MARNHDLRHGRGDADAEQDREDQAERSGVGVAALGREIAQLVAPLGREALGPRGEHGAADRDAEDLRERAQPVAAGSGSERTWPNWRVRALMPVTWACASSGTAAIIAEVGQRKSETASQGRTEI